MPEGMNVEVAHKLSEHERADRAKHRWQEPGWSGCAAGRRRRVVPGGSGR
jgi:hypothetical protein